MFSKLLVAALFAAVSALLEPYDQPAGAMLVPRAPAMTALPHQHARDLDSCIQAANDLTTTLEDDIPTPGPALLSLASLSPGLFTQTNPCEDPALPTTDAVLASEWKSYQTAFTSWQSKHLCDFKALLDECATIALVNDVISGSDLVCSTLLQKAASEDCATTTREENSSKPTLGSQPTVTATTSTASDSSTGTSTGSGSSSADAGDKNAAGAIAVAFGAVLAGVVAFIAGL